MPATPTARQLPAGIYLKNGWKALITLASKPDLELWEITTGAPGIAGGTPVDTTTQHNNVLVTREPSSLIDLTPFDTTCAFDPIIYTRALTYVNRKDTITVRFPDGTTLAMYGWLQNLSSPSLTRGAMPTMTVTWCPANQNSSTGAEEAFTLTNVAGT